MTCKIKHYDCVEQSDCLDCRHDKLMRTLAIELLTRAGMELIESDITILADDLAKVHYEPVVDGYYKASYSIQDLFWSRIGGSLYSYMNVIRPKGKR